jgi:GT2 family glycosyltransferase/SAM-dependent methyltransferase
MTQEASETIIRNTDNNRVPQPEDNIFSARRSTVHAVLDDGGPLASIFVPAYNRLDKTRTCVESILKYTSDIDYELVLVDNGSSDGTLHFFQSVSHSRKKIIRVTKNIGAFYGGNLGIENATGKFIVAVANDVYVTRNWLSNMLKCAESDPRIGMVNPRASNVSNLQHADIAFKGFKEMQEKAAKHNTPDPRKWHERLRLVTLGTVFKRECLDMVGKGDYGFFHDFADDDLTFRARRAGYKAILCGDVFVHHDHDLLKDNDLQELTRRLEKGKAVFREKYFGVDAWDDVNNYEINMMSMVNPEEKRGSPAPAILGMDVLCGTPILELKNKLRMADIFDASLSAYTSDAKYYVDLKTICDGKVHVDRTEYLSEHFDGDKFDYIIVGKQINAYREPYRLLQDLLSLLKPDGHLFIKLSNTYDIRSYFNTMGNAVPGDGGAAYQISLEDLTGYLARHRYGFKSITADLHSLEESLASLLKKAIQSSGIARNVDEAFTKMMVRDYVIDVVRQ